MSAGKEGRPRRFGWRLAEMLVNLFNARGREEVRLWKTNCWRGRSGVGLRSLIIVSFLFFFMLFSRFLLRIIEIYRNKEEILIVGSLSFLRMLFQSRFSFEVTKVFQINWTWEKSYQVIQKRKYRSLIYRLCFLRILFQCNFFKVTRNIYRLILKSRVLSFKHAFINSNHSRSTSNVI